MIPVLLLVAVLFLGMLLPHLPGRYDASAAALSSAIQVASHASLLLVPVGLAWLLAPRRARVWQRCARVVGALVMLAVVAGAAAVNHLATGVVLAAGALGLLRAVRRRTLAETVRIEGRRHRLAFSLAVVPLVLVTFAHAAVPRAAAWSRDRAIRHAARFVAAIEAFRQRRGHYPVSLRSLHADFPTGVMGIERFEYDPNGDSYHVFFVRPAVALDAQEVVMFHPLDAHCFASHELDILQFDGETLALRRGDRRRTALAQPHWVSILFD